MAAMNDPIAAISGESVSAWQQPGLTAHNAKFEGEDYGLHAVP